MKSSVVSKEVMEQNTLDKQNPDLKEWLTDSIGILGPKDLSVYAIGTVGTKDYTEDSDVDLIYVVAEALPDEKKRAIRILTKLWENRLRLDIHFIKKSDLKLDDHNIDAFLITCCLAWQGSLLHGQKLSFPKPDEFQTKVFHAIRIYKSLLKAEKQPTERNLNSIARGLLVLNEEVDWKLAFSKSNLAKSTRNMSYAELLNECRQGLERWKLPNELKEKLSSLL